MEGLRRAENGGAALAIPYPAAIMTAGILLYEKEACFPAPELHTSLSHPRHALANATVWRLACGVLYGPWRSRNHQVSQLWKEEKGEGKGGKSVAVAKIAGAAREVSKASPRQHPLLQGICRARERRDNDMIRKLTSGQYRLYSRKKDPKTGRRRNLGTFTTRKAAEAHERAVQYFKAR